MEGNKKWLEEDQSSLCHKECGNEIETNKVNKSRNTKIAWLIDELNRKAVDIINGNKL